MQKNVRLQVLLATCGAWHLPHTAKALYTRGALSELWTSDRSKVDLPAAKARRSWPFHLAMRPFYQFASQIVVERTFYALFPLWKAWVKTQQLPKGCNVVQGIMGYCTELFDATAGKSILRVVDCPNSHPLTYFGFWQRECDLWCPGEQVPIPRWMFARMTRELEMADLIVVQSTFCKDSMLWNGIPEHKVFVSPMGVDTRIFKPRRNVPSRPRFVCVGTICLRKGHQYLFRAFSEVKKAVPDAELICVGSYKADFRKERARWEGTFTHLEHLEHSEVSSLLQSCSAFVFPSQEEGIARAQIEALACGLPVIGTHEGGSTTLIQDGVEGFIVGCRNVAALARAMIGVVQDPVRNRLMGQAAYVKGAYANTWQDYGDRLLNRMTRQM
jgi:starch synthase